ncbi:FAD-binding domain-containing protein, partial [Streptomyces violascens]
DPHGSYVTRWVPELAGLERKFLHEPWKLKPTDRAGLDYPDPVVDLAEGRARFEQARGI